MKTHIKSGGKLLQTNKKWSHLKNSQREWIYKSVRDEHAAYVEKHGRLPMKKSKLTVINNVYDKIVERGIWIPYGEAEAVIGKCIDRENRKSPLFVPPTKKKIAPATQKPPSAPLTGNTE